MLPILLLVLSVLLPSSHALDFCVGDAKGPRTPSGYTCKDPSTVTVDDFIFTGLAKAGNTSNIVKAAATLAVVEAFPGLNGLGISAGRLDLAPGGAIPLHSHPHASEMLVVIRGIITTGFISTDNVAYYKTLKEGETIVYPQGLLHFQVNTGKVSAMAIVTLGNESPGFQTTSSSTFGNDLPSYLVEAVTLIDHAEVQRLKALIGGANI